MYQLLVLLMLWHNHFSLFIKLTACTKMCMHQLLVSATCFGAPQVVSSGNQCMLCVCCKNYAFIFLVYVYIVS